MNLAAILPVSMILFSVIDIVGSLPVIINLKKEGLVIKPVLATLYAGLIMLAFLFFGAAILSIFGIEVSSFALAGSLIIFFIGLERILGIRFSGIITRRKVPQRSADRVPASGPEPGP